MDVVDDDRLVATTFGTNALDAAEEVAGATTMDVDRKKLAIGCCDAAGPSLTSTRADNSTPPDAEATAAFIVNNVCVFSCSLRSTLFFTIVTKVPGLVCCRRCWCCCCVGDGGGGAIVIG